MASPTTMTALQLSRRIGLPDAPVILDVRIAEDVAADLRCLPGANARHFRSVPTWAGEFTVRNVVVSCQ